MYAAVEEGTQSAEYKSQWWRREALPQAVMTSMANNDLDKDSVCLTRFSTLDTW